MTGVLAGHRRVVGSRSTGRLILAAFMAWALFLQAYVTASHIHPDDMPGASSVAAAAASPGHHGRSPIKDDSAKCPICQQIGRAGQYVAPSWLTPLLLVQAVSVIEIATFERRRFTAVSHIWRGRGPPRD